jgi:dimethyl sulfoxide reductase iron-sulfur subunit
MDDNTTLVTRRELLKIMLGAGVSVGAAVVLAGPLAPVLKSYIERLEPAGTIGHPGRDRPHWGMVIDLDKCIGCRYCVLACQAVNDVPDHMRWNIHLEDETPTGNVFHMTRPCLHCQNAPCVKVCPVEATYVRHDGLVVMDYDRCIGCRYCQAACPYDARVFNWDDRAEDANPYAPEWGSTEVPRRARGVVEKCTFCIHRIDRGLERGQTPGIDPEATPACVNICPVEARYFGNLNDPSSPVARIIATTPTLRLRDDLGTEASVYYVPPRGLTL